MQNVLRKPSDTVSIEYRYTETTDRDIRHRRRQRPDTDKNKERDLQTAISAFVGRLTGGSSAKRYVGAIGLMRGRTGEAGPKDGRCCANGCERCIQ